MQVNLFTDNLITFSFLFHSWTITQNQLHVLTAPVLNLLVTYVSPVYNKKFFECQLQTITRVVCFSARKHKIFTDYSGKKSSIRVKKFNADTSSNTNDMLMGDTVIVEHYPQLDSPDQRFNLQPRFHQSNQCLKAKVTNMSKEEMAGDLTLMNCTLLDPTASVRMVSWENFINQVENNRTYMSHNVTVRKDKYHYNIYLNTAKYGTEVKLTQDFTEVLAMPLTQDTTQFVSTTVEGEMLGITTINSYFSCFKCNKKTRTIYCSNIFRVQKLPLNPLTPKISFVILLTVCHTVLMILVWRIWYWINLYSLNL